MVWQPLNVSSCLAGLLRIILDASKLDVCVLDPKYGCGSILWY